MDPRTIKCFKLSRELDEQPTKRIFILIFIKVIREIQVTKLSKLWARFIPFRMEKLQEMPARCKSDSEREKKKKPPAINYSAESTAIEM